MTTETEAPAEVGAAEAFAALQEEIAALGQKIEAMS